MEENLLEALKDLTRGQKFTFQLGYGTKHAAKALIEQSRSKHSQVLTWASQSPDLYEST